MVSTTASKTAIATVTFKVTNATGKSAGTVKAPAAVFGIANDEVQAHIPLIHQVVVAQQAAARQGTHSVKTRGDVSGGGKKPWKQKGTGRARQGSIRSPQWVHGGVAHGPVPRKYDQRTPKKMKAAALRYVLSDRANAGRIAIVDLSVKDKPSTKAAVAALNPITADSFTTVVLSRENVNEWLSLRNIPTVHVIFADQLNPYDVVSAQYVVFTKDGFNAFLAAKSEAAVADAEVQAADTESDAVTEAEADAEPVAAEATADDQTAESVAASTEPKAEPKAKAKSTTATKAKAKSAATTKSATATKAKAKAKNKADAATDSKPATKKEA